MVVMPCFAQQIHLHCLTSMSTSQYDTHAKRVYLFDVTVMIIYAEINANF